LYSSANIFRISKSRRIRWMKHAWKRAVRRHTLRQEDNIKWILKK
jgi:hypothetical protein